MPTNRLRYLLAALAAAAALAQAPRDARACGAPIPEAVAASPATGATDVPPASSIFLTLPLAGATGLALKANGAAVPVTVEELGLGEVNKYLRLRAALAPATSYVLSGQVEGTARELTRFTTAAKAAAPAGTAPTLSWPLRLWQVHYVGGPPGHECALQAIEGYLDLPYTPGTVPGTPDAEVVNVLTVTPKAGGQKQTYVFTGAKPQFFTRLYSSLGINDATADFPSPIFSPFRPALDPSLEYCATLTVMGRNDQAGPPLTTASGCASVTVMARDSQKPVPVPDGGATTPMLPPAPPPDSGVGPPGFAFDSGGPTGVQPPATGGGCAVGGPRPAAPLLVLLLGLAALRVRRRR